MSGVEVGPVVLVWTSTTEVASVTADLYTRCGELYASVAEVLPAGRGGEDVAAAEGPAALPPAGKQFQSLARLP